jgi:hypothetical protein
MYEPFVMQISGKPLHLLARELREHVRQVPQSATFLSVLSDMLEQELLVGFAVEACFARIDPRFADRLVVAPSEMVADSPAPPLSLYGPRIE